MLRSHCLFEKVSATNRSIEFHCRMKVTYCSLYRAENPALHGIPELSSPINNPLDNLAGESYKNYNYSMSCDLIVDLCSERLGISIGLHDISIGHRLRQDIRRNQGVQWSSSCFAGRWSLMPGRFCGHLKLFVWLIGLIGFSRCI